MKVGAIYIEVTSNCNLNCKYCYNNSGEKKHEIELNLLSQVFDSCNKMGINSIAISGGEPYLHKDIEKIIELLKEKKFNNVVLITNGMSSRIFENIDILDYLDFLQISLDSVLPDFNDQYRNYGNCNIVKSNIKKLCDLGYNNKIVINCVIHQKNYYDINNLVLYAIKNKLKAVNFEFLQLQGRTNRNMIISDAGMIHKIINQLKVIKRDVENKIEIGIPTIKSGCPFLKGLHNKVFPKIDYEGDVFICDSLVDKKFVIGNIHNDLLEDIIVIDKVRNKQPIFDKVNEKCTKCDKYMKCPGACLSHCNTELENDETICKYKNLNIFDKIFINKI